ncbi:hypothetical protein [Halocynthiibacter namhaensis]|nr:hypothetical protein [Halocynthiibacter namhaensis]
MTMFQVTAGDALIVTDQNVSTVNGTVPTNLLTGIQPLQGDNTLIQRR